LLIFPPVNFSYELNKCGSLTLKINPDRYLAYRLMIFQEIEYGRER